VSGDRSQSPGRVRAAGQAAARQRHERLLELHQTLADKLSTRIAAPDLWWGRIKLVACFYLASGALLEWVEGTLQEHDCRLLSKLLSAFTQGDVVLADRAFSSYASLATLWARGVDAVMRVHHFRKLDGRTGRQGKLWTAEQWAQLPAELTVRLMEIHVVVPGFRTQRLVLVTTLTDASIYSAEKWGRLYFRRWAVELFFRDIQTTLGLDVLRGQTPAMVRKEIVMHALAYNLIRALMQDIAQSYQIHLSRLSFQGTVDALRQWRELLEATQGSTRKTSRLPTKPRHEMRIERCRKQSQRPSEHALN